MHTFSILRLDNNLLISLVRFDLIFLMLDPQNELFDRRLARHLVSLYYKSRDEEEDELMVSSSILILFVK